MQHDDNMKIDLLLNERKALSPKEFASLFGRDATWAYRLIYAKKLKSTNALGHTLIPVTEADRILNNAQYVVSEKRSRSKRKSNVAG